MPHWKSMMDRDYIYAFDLNGKDVVVTIARITGGTLTGDGGRKSKKPVAFFEGKEKGLALNATNCKTIAKLFGSNDTDRWIGRQITLYPTTTEMGGETKDCIRVRTTIPRGTNKGGARQTGSGPAGPSVSELEAALREQITGESSEPDADEQTQIKREEAESAK